MVWTGTSATATAAARLVFAVRDDVLEPLLVAGDRVAGQRRQLDAFRRKVLVLQRQPSDLRRAHRLRSRVTCSDTHLMPVHVLLQAAWPAQTAYTKRRMCAREAPFEGWLMEGNRTVKSAGWENRMAQLPSIHS